MAKIKVFGNIVRTANLAAFRVSHWKPNRSTFDMEVANKKMMQFVEEAFSRQSTFYNRSENCQPFNKLMLKNFGDELTNKPGSLFKSEDMVQIERSFADGLFAIIENQWNEFKGCMNRIDTAFLHYNDLIAKKSNKDKVIDPELEKFRNFILCNHEVKLQLQTNLLKSFADHRVECPL